MPNPNAGPVRIDRWGHPHDARRATHMHTEAQRNRLLAALADEDLERWSPHLERVELSVEEVLGAEPASTTYAYFPTTALVALLQEIQPAEWLEVALVGRDGGVGLPGLPGAEAASQRAVVRSAGTAF